MNAEQQRIAIAKACGWTSEIPNKETGVRLWLNPALPSEPPSRRFEAGLPNYLSDLNAMHEAEKQLTGIQRVQYLEHLFRISAVDREWYQVCATAAQRAEAFLRTLDLWKD